MSRVDRDRPGSISFEMIRKLVERLPVMVTPRWVHSVAQPISIEDVLDYLVAALDVEVEGSVVFEIGGADPASYEEPDDRLWQLRGLIDLLAGGVGVRRGRRNPGELTSGATLDFWRVEAYELDHLLRLRAEMELPGRAWLQPEVDGDDSGSTIRVCRTATT